MLGSAFLLLRATELSAAGASRPSPRLPPFGLSPLGLAMPGQNAGLPRPALGPSSHLKAAAARATPGVQDDGVDGLGEELRGDPGTLTYGESMSIHASEASRSRRLRLMRCSAIQLRVGFVRWCACAEVTRKKVGGTFAAASAPTLARCYCWRVD
jgi:hypothetical protein